MALGRCASVRVDGKIEMGVKGRRWCTGGCHYIWAAILNRILSTLDRSLKCLGLESWRRRVKGDLCLRTRDSSPVYLPSARIELAMDTPPSNNPIRATEYSEWMMEKRTSRCTSNCTDDDDRTEDLQGVKNFGQNAKRRNEILIFWQHFIDIPFINK